MSLNKHKNRIKIKLDAVNNTDYDYTLMDDIRIKELINIVLERKVPTQIIDETIQKLKIWK